MTQITTDGMQQSVLKELVFKASIWNSSQDAGLNDKNNKRNQERRDSSLPDAYRRRSSDDPFRRDFDNDIRRLSYALHKGGAVDYDDSEGAQKETNADREKELKEQPKRQTSDEAVNEVIWLWRFLCRETTCHGVKNIESAYRRRPSRVLWLLIVLGMSAGLFYNVVMLIIHYHQFQTVTRTDVRVSTKATFPSITLCNACPYKRDKHEKNNPLFQLVAQTTIFSDLISVNLSDPLVQETLNTSLMDAQENYSYKIHEIIQQAHFEGKPLNLLNDFEVVDTRFGRCFTFNGPKFIKKYGVREAHYDGRQSGLQLMAHIHQDKYLLYDDMTAGMKMFIAHHPETPRLEKDGIDLPPGVSTKVALSPIEYTFQPAPYKSYGSESCVEEEILQRRPHTEAAPFYSHSACIEECLNLAAARNCSCYTTLLIVESLPPCTVRQEFFCMGPFRALYTNRIDELSCDCPRPCTLVRYDTVVSGSQFPSRASTEFILNLINETDADRIRDNYIEVRVYLETMVLRHEMHEAKYTFSSVFAYLGGQMGFFMGASLITMTEFLEAILMSALLCFRKKLLVLGELKRPASVKSDDKA